STHIYSDGSLSDLISLPGGGSQYPCSKETILKRLHFMKMKGNETFKVAVRTLEQLATRTLEENNLEPSQLSLLIPHQANLRIIHATAKRLGLPPEKVFINIEKYGNTSAASIPIALDEAVLSGKCTEGEYILLEAFGGGLTWASALLRW
ncbi:MAG: 3-oxoacyl-ACP synthase, partial [Nitrospiraceae bacterium]